MPVNLPGEIVEKLIIAVHTVAGIGKPGRTKVRQTAHFNRGQAEIAGQSRARTK